MVQRRALGRQLRAAVLMACRAQGIQMDDLAKRAEVPMPDLRALLAGRSATIDTLVRVCDVAGLQLWVRHRTPGLEERRWHPGRVEPGDLLLRTLRGLCRLREQLDDVVLKAKRKRTK